VTKQTIRFGVSDFVLSDMHLCLHVIFFAYSYEKKRNRFL